MKSEVALITGASRGLGRKLATQLALTGTRVGMLARGKEELDAAVAEIVELVQQRLPPF